MAKEIIGPIENVIEINVFIENFVYRIIVRARLVLHDSVNFTSNAFYIDKRREASFALLL